MAANISEMKGTHGTEKTTGNQQILDDDQYHDI